MMKIIAMISAVLFLSGCELKESRFCAKNGFSYIMFSSWPYKTAVAPDFNDLGLPKRCENDY